MVDDDGKNCYPRDEIWMTDGYGAYVRHYLRAMAWWPELAPAFQDHLLSSTSMIQLIDYPQNFNKFQMHEVLVGEKDKTLISYRTFDEKSTEILRLTARPGAVLINQKPVPESYREEEEGWSWKALGQGGVLTIRHINGNKIIILAN
jgi:hypothetical protein